MEKTKFLKQLQEQLAARGLEDSAIKAQIERVSNYIEQTGMDDVEVDPSDMADGIVKAVGKPAKPAPFVAPEEPIEEAAVPLSAEDEINAAIKRLEDEDAQHEEKIADVSDEAEDDSAEEDTPDLVADDVEPTDAESEEEPIEEAQAESVSESPEEPKEEEKLEKGFVRIMAPEDVKSDSPDDSIDDVRPYRPARNERDKKLMRKYNKQEYKEEKRQKKEENKAELSDEDIAALRNNKTLFIILSCVVAPFVLALALIVVALYIFFWLALALLLIFSVAGLIVFVALGSCISLIGIVYGVIQIVAGATPAGLFEIGLGICVGGAVLLISILVYNFAMRLVPFAMRQLARLVRFAFSKGRDAYTIVKGVCEKI
jgi:uncharacterized membrane protein